MGMTIDEAIERFKNNAEYERTHGNLQGCLEFRQLAEWLRKYKEMIDVLNERGIVPDFVTMNKLIKVVEDGNDD